MIQMEKEAIKNLSIRIRNKSGEEGWIQMSEFSKALIETVGEAINETAKEIGKELTSTTGSENK